MADKAQDLFLRIAKKYFADDFKMWAGCDISDKEIVRTHMSQDMLMKFALLEAIEKLTEVIAKEKNIDFKSILSDIDEVL